MIVSATAVCVIASSTRCAMKKATLLSILVVAVQLAGGVIAEAQQPKKIPRIGFLAATPSASSDRTDTFRQGLRELGYGEGENIIMENRRAEGQFERLPDLAAELVHLKVEGTVALGA